MVINKYNQRLNGKVKHTGVSADRKQKRKESKEAIASKIFQNLKIF